MLSGEWATRDRYCDWHGHRESRWKKGKKEEERGEKDEIGDSHDIDAGVT